MTFPTEGVEQLRRRMLDICQDQSRKVLEAAREIPLLIEALKKGDVEQVNERVSRVIKLEEEARNYKRTLMRELSEAGALLSSREDIFRLSASINEIADFAGGIAHRISEVAYRKWSIDDETFSVIIELADAMLNTISKLRETILSLSYGAHRTVEFAKNVEAAEKVVDDLYRKADVAIISSKLSIPLIFILRDIIDLMENMADKAEDAADIAQILALSAI